MLEVGIIWIRPQITMYWSISTLGLRISHKGESETLTSEFHHLQKVGPNPLCALAHLGCTHKEETS